MSVIYKLFVAATTLTLAYFIGTAGLNKLTPMLDKGVHEYLVNVSQHWPGIFNPIFEKYGIAFEGSSLLRLIGTCETSAAVGLVLSLFLLPSSIGTLAAFLILPIMAGALYLHHVTNTPNDNALIVTGLCFLRLILDIFRPSAGKAKAK